METFKLWENGAPGGGEEPQITFYPAKDKAGDGCVVIFAGGGYSFRSPHEDQGYAKFLSSSGINSFTVSYRVFPSTFPLELLDARRGVRYVRANAAKFGIDPSKIAVMGSSAGGHLAALVSTYRESLEPEGADGLDEISPYPNATILCYPVISSDSHIWHEGSYRNLLGDKLIGKKDSFSPDLIADDNTPPAFIWHTSDDSCVNVINSYRYAEALRRHGIQTEMHIFPSGSHGLGLADEGDHDIPYVARWSGLLIEWLRYIGFIN